MNDISKHTSDFTGVVAAADDSVKALLGGARGLRHFLQTVDKLPDEDQEKIVNQAIAMLEGFYAHLPLKRAMHAVDPLQRLRLLRRRLLLDKVPSEIAFHSEMTSIFTSLRDLHTNYLLPTHFAQVSAILPFRVKRCRRPGPVRDWMYLVSEVLSGTGDPAFVKGVEVTHWNAVPIERAVEIAADYHAGSNHAARLARGIEGLTLRVMLTTPPPDEEWVVVGYKDLSGQARELQVEWKVINLPVASAESDAPEAVVAPVSDPVAGDINLAMGVDIEADARRRVTAALFASHVQREKQRIGVEVRRRTATAEWTQEGVKAAVSDGVVGGLNSILPEIFFAGSIPSPHGAFGYLRIRTFSVSNHATFVDEVKRLITRPEFPRSGMVLDVRGNGGGLIWAGERLLQLFTPTTIEPTRAQFISTSQTIELCQKSAQFVDWRASLDRTLETGAPFSAAYPITPPAWCNDIGQVYRGPVVLLTDARCYSTTDMFAAGFKDHGIGPILGVDDNTGAGGANVWRLQDIFQLFKAAGLKSPFEQTLPSGAGMRVAVRRTLRRDGAEIEDLGVPVDHLHDLTRDDVLSQDTDLLQAAAQLLADLPRFGLDASAILAGGKAKVSMTTSGLDRIDAHVDGRPGCSVDVADGDSTLQVAAAAGAVIGLKGFKDGELKAYRRLDPLT